MHGKAHLTHMGLEMGKEEDALYFYDPEYVYSIFDGQSASVDAELIIEYLDGKFSGEKTILDPFFCIAIGDPTYARDQALISLDQAEALAQFLMIKVAKARKLFTEAPVDAPVV